MNKSKVKVIHRLVATVYWSWSLFYASLLVAALVRLGDSESNFQYLALSLLFFLISKTLEKVYYTDFYWRYFPESKPDKL